METIAWMGAAVLCLVLAACAVVALMGMLTDPIGRAVVLGWTVIGVVAWGLLGAAYLIVKAI